jgi:glutamate 5-kinase
VIAGPDGRPLARGLAEYPAEDAVRITGKRSEEQADPRLRPALALVHRSHMALL